MPSRGGLVTRLAGVNAEGDVSHVIPMKLAPNELA